MSEPATGRSVEAQLMDSMFKEKLLSEKIAAANAENSVLKTKIDEINTEAEQSQSKQGDLIWFYRKENEQKDKVIANLTQTNQKLELLIRELKENKDDELKRMESQNAAVRKELQEHLEKLTRESKSLKEFREQKRELEMELTQLKATIENENKEMIKKVNDLERLNVAEKERLKKEMLKKIKETKLSLLAMTEDQLHTTTKRAIMENEQMAIELQYQSKETERLLAKNAKLIKEKLALKRELELHKETEAILAKRTSFFQKLIKKLHTKSKANDRKINEFEASQRANARANASNMFVENQVIRQLEAQLENSEMARRASDAECDLARSQCQQARQTLNQFLDLQDESITFIWTEIEHVRNEVKKYGGTLKTLNEDERHLLLCKLHARLQKLKESFAHQMYSVFEDIQPSIHMNEPHDETNADNANFQETHNPYKRDGLLQT